MIFTSQIGARPFIPQLLAILILEQLSSAFLTVATQGENDEINSRFYFRRWCTVGSSAEYLQYVIAEWEPC